MSALEPEDAAAIDAAARGAKGVRVVYPVLPLPGVHATSIRTTDEGEECLLRVGTRQDVDAVETITALVEAVRGPLAEHAPAAALVVEIATIE